MLRKFLYKWFGQLDALHVSYDNAVYDEPAVVFIHGIGSSGAMWQQVITELGQRADVRILAVDLLGFGESPKPEWAQYSTHEHAKALAKTLRRRGIHQAIFVGHSLGSLVAIEYAKLHASRVMSLVLCSPPFYQLKDGKRFSADKLYMKLYEKMRAREDRTLKLGQLLQEKIRPGRGFILNELTLPAFVKSLESSIEKQTSLEDAIGLPRPIAVLYGTLDPVVLAKNIKKLQKANAHVTVQSVVAGHEISKRYAVALLHALMTHLEAAYPKASHPK